MIRLPRLDRCLAGAALALALLLPSSVAADDRAAGESLFEEGRELAARGEHAAACEKFAASLALLASASTAINLGRCQLELGRVASAWSSFKQALVLNRETRGDERRQELAAIAADGIAALEPRLPKLELTMASPPPGLVIERSGAPVPVSALGTALPVDPGDYVVTARAPGYETTELAVTLVEGEVVVLELRLAPAPRPAKKPAPEPAAPAAEASVPLWAWIALGGGAAFTGLAIGFLVDDLDAIGDLEERCGDKHGISICESGYDFHADNARKDRSFGLFIGFGAGAAGALAAALVGIAGPATAESARVVPVVLPRGAGLMVGGAL